MESKRKRLTKLLNTGFFSHSEKACGAKKDLVSVSGDRACPRTNGPLISGEDHGLVQLPLIEADLLMFLLLQLPILKAARLLVPGVNLVHSLCRMCLLSVQ